MWHSLIRNNKQVVLRHKEVCQGVRSVAPSRCALCPAPHAPISVYKAVWPGEFQQAPAAFFIDYFTSLMYMLSTSAAVRSLRREGNRRPILQSTKPVGARAANHAIHAWLTTQFRAANHAEIAVQIVAAASLSCIFGQGDFHARLDNATGAPGAGTKAGVGGALAPQRGICLVTSC